MKSGSQFVGWLSYFNDDSKKKGILAMEKITKEQIDEVMMNMETRVCDNIGRYFHENIENVKNSNKEENISDMDIAYIAALNTMFQMSVDTIKLCLYELLCEE